MKRLSAVDLFCGAGGLSLGLKQAAFRVLAACDLNPLASRTYTMNHRRTKVWTADLRELDAKEFRAELGLQRGDLDLLAACPPCQGFSTMRTRNGKLGNHDARNDLVSDVSRFVAELFPKSVMLENVPGLATDKRFRVLADELRELGYHLKFDILNAVDFGVPQRRRRLILLGSRFEEPQFAKPLQDRATVRAAIGDINQIIASDDPLHFYQGIRSPRIARLISQIPKDGGSRSALGRDLQLRCHQKVNGFRDVYGRMAWAKPAPTITGGCINPSKGRFLHPEEDRPISLREAAILQTFPPEYRFPTDHGRYPIALLIGNALPPEFIRRHALALRKAIPHS